MKYSVEVGMVVNVEAKDEVDARNIAIKTLAQAGHNITVKRVSDYVHKVGDIFIEPTTGYLFRVCKDEDSVSNCLIRYGNQGDVKYFVYLSDMSLTLDNIQRESQNKLEPVYWEKFFVMVIRPWAKDDPNFGTTWYGMGSIVEPTVMLRNVLAKYTKHIIINQILVFLL